MNEWMDGWMDGCMDGRMDESINQLPIRQSVSQSFNQLINVLYFICAFRCGKILVCVFLAGQLTSATCVLARIASGNLTYVSIARQYGWCSFPKFNGDFLVHSYICDIFYKDSLGFLEICAKLWENVLPRL